MKLTPSHYMILDACGELQPYAFGIAINEWLERALGEKTSLGMVYAMLSQLELGGLLQRRIGPTAADTNHTRILYELTDLGKARLVPRRKPA